MNYSDEELQIMNEEALFQEMMQDAFSNVEMMPAVMINLIASDNDTAFYKIYDMMREGNKLSVKMGITKGVPYYELEIPNDNNAKIYLNKELIRFFYDWFTNGIIAKNIPDFSDIHKNVNDRYILYLLRRDRQNGTAHYNKETKEYKAIYPYATINYGQLPYTTEELVAKLNSLS